MARLGTFWRESFRVAQARDLARSLLGQEPRGALETYARLARTLVRVPRHTPGTFRFPFGTLRYADSASLVSQYHEIWVRRGYDFGPCAAPRILDCGGNIGLSAIWFRQRYRNSRLTVFEADPTLAQMLRANLEALGFTDVEVVAAAVWSRAGFVAFQSDGADSGRVVPTATQQVPAIRLADWLGEPVDLLKLDIEGAEYEVLADLFDSGCAPHIRRLACEVHGSRATQPALAALLAALSQHGFCYTLAHARPAPDLPAVAEPTPFPAAPDGKFLLHLYAWQPDQAPSM